MPTTPRLFSPTNVFIPSATNEVIGYIRTPGQFKLLDYVQMVPSTSKDDGGKPICVYSILDPDAPVRTGPLPAQPVVTNPDIQGAYMPSVDVAWRWAPGDDAPRGNIVSNFKWQTVEMHRRAYPYEYDEQTDLSADLPVGQIYRQIAASLAMTVKTHRVIKMLETQGNWPTTNTNTVQELLNPLSPPASPLGCWDKASSVEGTEDFISIRRSLQQAAVNIVKMTNSAVRPEDLRVIVSPTAAMRMGSSSEIYSYVKSSPFSQARQEGRNQLNEQYGVPKFYAGLEIVVEDSPIVLEEYNAAGTPATTNRVWVKGDDTAIMVSRKGGLNGVYGAPSFSTVQLFYYRFEMSVEQMHDVWNKKHKGRVVDQFAEVLTANRAGYLIRDILSTV